MNLWVKVRTATNKLPYRAVITLMLSLAVISIIPFDAVFAALSNTSPNPSDVSAGGTAGGVSHLIKNETVAHVTTLRLGAYYPTAGAAGKELHIRYGIDGKKCLIVNSIVRQGGNVFVTIAGQTTKQYKIPIGRVCNDIGSPARDNVEGSNSGWGNNKFFANYAFPKLNYDASIDKYYANVTIEYGSGVQEGQSDENSVNFITNVVGDSGNGIIAPLSNNRPNELGVRSAYFQDGTSRNVKVATPFGIPCSETKDWFDVKLFDPDDTVFGETILRVTENGNVLPRTRYDESRSRYVGAWDASRNGFRAQKAPSNDYSSIRVIGAGKSKNYRFIITNYITPGYVTPNANVLSIGIPYDSIESQVNCNYGLHPHVKINSGNLYSYTPSVDVEGWITKSGAGPVPETHPWEIRALRYSQKPNTNINGDSGAINPCSQAPSANRIGGCDLVAGTSQNYPNKDDITSNYASGGPDAVGTYLCFFTRIQNPSEDPNDDDVWRYSDMTCAKSGIAPKIQVLGGDTKVFGTIDTSLSTIQGNTFGSFDEYGVFSNGRNYNMASGSGLLGGNANSAQSSWSGLTFGNTPTFGNFGGLALPSFNPGTGTDPGPTLAATNYGDGTKKVLVFNGNLTITGNQKYVYNNGSNYASISDIPDVKIVANNITIAAGVTQIDAWLVARNSLTGAYGNISTCDSVAGFKAMNTADLLNSTICKNKLTINAPVVANSLFAYRTNDSMAGDPAEVFNLRANNWLSSFVGGATTRPVAQTDTVTDLPPRF